MKAHQEARLAAIAETFTDVSCEISTRTVMNLYRTLGVAVKRTTARSDLKVMVNRGQLVAVTRDGRRAFQAKAVA